MKGLHITRRHTGKMELLQSLSTSPLLNPLCMERRDMGDSICSHCYAFRQMKMYPGLREVLARNTELLSEIIPDDQLPKLNAIFFRFEAFGDLFCVNQVLNYFHICNKNPLTKFALWTKNVRYLTQAMALESKPANLQVIYSSPLTNCQSRTKAKGVDKVFTVYDKKHIEKGDVTINCGAKSCFDCHICYENNGIRYINEKLK